MLYSLRAYPSQKIAESGLASPREKTATGAWVAAQKYAKDMAADHGYCLVVNNETGERHNFGLKE